MYNTFDLQIALPFILSVLNTLKTTFGDTMAYIPFLFCLELDMDDLRCSAINPVEHREMTKGCLM